MRAAGDLRGEYFRCSRCGRDLSGSGFAQRVSHVKKCAAAAAAVKEAREAPLPPAFLPFVGAAPVSSVVAEPAPALALPATNVRAWLGGLQLERYADAFEAEEVDMACVPVLTSEDLLALGILNPGERRRALAGAAALGTPGGGPDKAGAPRPPDPGPRAAPARARSSAAVSSGRGASGPARGSMCSKEGQAAMAGAAAAPSLTPRTPAEEAAQLAMALAASLVAGRAAAHPRAAAPDSLKQVRLKALQQELAAAEEVVENLRRMVAEAEKAEAAAAAPGGFYAANALQHAHSLAAYGIADPAAVAQAILASQAASQAANAAGFPFTYTASPGAGATPPAAAATLDAVTDGLAEGGSVDGLLAERAQAAAAASTPDPTAPPAPAPRAKRARPAVTWGSSSLEVDIGQASTGTPSGATPRGRDTGASALDSDAREALSALSKRLAQGFCAETAELDLRARAAVLRGFLGSVRETVGDEDVCMPAGGAVRFLHVYSIGNRLTTASEAVAVPPPPTEGAPLL
ncbi:hypothetical protein WJX81_003564 [Elliptochloris bilobata]|uniref:SAM domain-containing protein n=1 Tax=Elliptochloris bilobata TaxID=381761 RepID=A0AAW1RBY4_9CHLO